MEYVYENKEATFFVVGKRKLTPKEQKEYENHLNDALRILGPIEAIGLQESC